MNALRWENEDLGSAIWLRRFCSAHYLRTLPQPRETVRGTHRCGSCGKTRRSGFSAITRRTLSLDGSRPMIAARSESWISTWPRVVCSMWDSAGRRRSPHTMRRGPGVCSVATWVQRNQPGIRASRQSLVTRSGSCCGSTLKLGWSGTSHISARATRGGGGNRWDAMCAWISGSAGKQCLARSRTHRGGWSP